MPTPTTPSPESQDDNMEALKAEGAEVANEAVLQPNKEAIFELEKDSYGRFGEWAAEQIKELEEDILEECGPEQASA